MQMYWECVDLAAVAQGLVIGIILELAGVPRAGLLAFAVMMLAISDGLQVGLMAANFVYGVAHVCHFCFLLIKKRERPAAIFWSSCAHWPGARGRNFPLEFILLLATAFREKVRPA